MEAFNVASVLIGIACGVGGAFITMLVTHFQLTNRIEKHHTDLVNRMDTTLQTIKVLADNQERALKELSRTLNKVDTSLDAMQKFLVENEGTHDLIVQKMVDSFVKLDQRLEVGETRIMSLIKDMER